MEALINLTLNRIHPATPKSRKKIELNMNFQLFFLNQSS